MTYNQNDDDNDMALEVLDDDQNPSQDYIQDADDDGNVFAVDDTQDDTDNDVEYYDDQGDDDGEALDEQPARKNAGGNAKSKLFNLIIIGAGVIIGGGILFTVLGGGGEQPQDAPVEAVAAGEETPDTAMAQPDTVTSDPNALPMPNEPMPNEPVAAAPADGAMPADGMMPAEAAPPIAGAIPNAQTPEGATQQDPAAPPTTPPTAIDAALSANPPSNMPPVGMTAEEPKAPSAPPPAVAAAPLPATEAEMPPVGVAPSPAIAPSMAPAMAPVTAPEVAPAPEAAMDVTATDTTLPATQSAEITKALGDVTAALTMVNTRLDAVEKRLGAQADTQAKLADDINALKTDTVKAVKSAEAAKETAKEAATRMPALEEVADAPEISNTPVKAEPKMEKPATKTATASTTKNSTTKKKKKLAPEDEAYKPPPIKPQATAMAQPVSKPVPTSNNTSMTAQAAPASGGAWELRGATQGKAWIARKGSTELVVVGVGDNAPGLGKVTTIAQQNGSWKVTGTSGSLSQ